MGLYTDRLNSEYDEITRGMEALTQKAVDEQRDLTDDENAQLEREQKRRERLADESGRIIAHEQHTRDTYAMRAGSYAAVGMSGTAVPVVQPDEAVDLLREVPTPGHWAALLHRAWVKRDKAAQETLEGIYRAHQVIADNPGIVPVQVVAPVIDTMRNIRPLISSVSTRRPPGPKFDRPRIIQHVIVGQQATEKTPTESQALRTDLVPVTLMTQAGHLNISKQDIRWSQPSILSLVYDDFAKVYARVSDKAACADFVSAVTQTSEFPGAAAGPPTVADIDAALAAAAALISGTDGDEAELNHIWLSRDVAVNLASIRTQTGEKAYNVPLVNGTSGDLDGLRVTIDPRFAAGTAIAGDDSLVEFWEDLEGFLSVDEPDVLGQLVGYAGYSRLSVLVPDAFVQFTNATTAAARSTAGKK